MGIVRDNTCRLSALLLVVALGFAVVPKSGAQQRGEVPEIPEAELVFVEAVKAFDQGDYETAYRRFRLVADSYPVNRKTSAARLMAGKALYRGGQFRQALDALERLVQLFPTSRYVPDARRTQLLARQALEPSSVVGSVVNIGVLLPTEPDDISLTQALFNGVRLAVDEHNVAAGRLSPVRMIFRQSGTSEQATAIRSLIDENVAVIIGPLYSQEAIDAARIAEAAGVVMVAPLATDEVVARDRQYIFQANPTASMRGRLMAEFAIRNLRHSELGVVADLQNPLSERMAEGFQEEASRLGVRLRFAELLTSSNGWFRLQDRLETDSLMGVEAIYLPVTGGNAPSLIKAALESFDRIDVPVRLLGNKEWHELANKMQPSHYNVVYTNDYYVDESNPQLNVFVERYTALAGEPPNQLSYVGYDLTRFLIFQITAASSVSLPDRLRTAPPFYGLGIRLNFAGENVNHAMFYMRYRNGEIEKLF